MTGNSRDEDEALPIGAWKDTGAVQAMLSATRGEMYTALELYHRHVQHTLALQFGLIGSAAVMLGFVLRNSAPDPAVLNIARYGSAGLLFLVPLFAAMSVRITWRYYRLYVCALVYAAELHDAVGLADRHEHFLEIKREMLALPPCLSAPERTTRLVLSRTSGAKHTWFPYAVLTGIVGLVAAIAGVLIFLHFQVILAGAQQIGG